MVNKMSRKKLKDGYYICDYCARAFKVVDRKRIDLNLFENRDEILSHNVIILRCEPGKHRDLNNLNPRSSNYYYQKKWHEKNNKIKKRIKI